MLGHGNPVFRQEWPHSDPELAREDLMEMPVQVNGKVRGHIKVKLGTDEAELKTLAVTNEKVQVFLGGKQILRVVVVPDKLVNIVVR